MDYPAFRTLVKKLRAAQTAFFRAKGPRDELLKRARNLERAVDAELLRQPGEQSLFETDEDPA